MSLRVKSLLVASATMAILMVLLFVSARLILTESYGRLEQQDTQAHVDSNYIDETFVNNRLSLVMLIDVQGEVAYAKTYDLTLNRARSLAAQAQRQILQDTVLLVKPISFVQLRDLAARLKIASV